MNPAMMIYCEELEAEVKKAFDEEEMIPEAFEIETRMSILRAEIYRV